MPLERLQWPNLDPGATHKGRVLVRAVFERNGDWTKSNYISLYSALYGSYGAQALARGTRAIEKVLANNGRFELLAASWKGEDELVITDGREAILISKRAHQLPMDAPPPGARVRQLWRTDGIPRRSLQDLLTTGKAPESVAPPSQGSVPAAGREARRSGDGDAVPHHRTITRASSGLESLLIGRILGDRYRLDELLGRGGMGVVYGATDERLGRAVAVKVMAISASDPEAQERLRGRFQREARAAARLHHPNVVTVFDYGTDAPLGFDYLVMELLQGEDLAARLERSGPLPLGFAMRILEDAGRGLAAGHQAGLVHRDVKPANLFLEQTNARRDLRVRVLDFGIAQITAEGDETLTHLTMFGSGPLSPAYASPEQLRGAGDLSPASDVFSLAVTGYQSLTGRRPFDRSQIERMAAGQPVPVPSVRELDPRIPVPVDRVLRRGMQSSAAERYADAGEFADAIVRAARESDRADWVSGSRCPGSDRTLTDAGQTETQQAFGQPRGAAPTDISRGAVPVRPSQRFPAPASHQSQAATRSFRERVPSAAELDGRTLRIAPAVLRSGNPRRPFTHGWLAFEVLLRSEDGSLPFEEYRKRLFHPAPEIRALAEKIPGVPNAYQDLKHIRHDIRHGRVLVE